MSETAGASCGARWEADAGGASTPAAHAFVPLWQVERAAPAFVVDVLRVSGASGTAVDGPPVDNAMSPEPAAPVEIGTDSPPSAALAYSDGAEPPPQPVEVVRLVVDEAAIARAREEGYRAGMIDTQSGWQRERDQERQEMHGFMQGLAQAAADPRRIYAPLLELAVALAEQLVRGELCVSGDAIRRLVEGCLAELEQHPGKVDVSLHPHDLERFRALAGELPADIAVRGDPGLRRGDVRVETGRGAIEDFMADRLAALADSILQTAAQAAPQPDKPGATGESRAD